MSHALKKFLEGRSLTSRLVVVAMLPLSWMYGAIGALRAFLYRHQILPVWRAGIPVISIGNITAGGTGKTPMVDHVAKYFLQRGVRPAIVSRGYSGTVRSGVGVVCTGSGPLLPPETSGDEPYLLAKRNPKAIILVAPRRSEGVRMAEEEFGAEVIILDDGFQHMAVARDLNIALLDAKAPLGNGRVLPAGFLREFPSALKRADLFILTRWRGEDPELPVQKPTLHSRHHLAYRVVSLDGEELPLCDLKGKSGGAFAGIANPARFFKDLRAFGLNLHEEISFPDHTVYGPIELEDLARRARGLDYLITTEKDGVKLENTSFPVPCFMAPLSIEFEKREMWENYLDSFLADNRF